MALFDEIEREVQSVYVCSLQAVINELDPVDQAGLIRALATDRKRIPHLAIVRVLRNRDYVVDPDVVSAHRRGTCRCRDSKTS